MTDEQIENSLRRLPAPELPSAWRGEILSAARLAEDPPPTRNRRAAGLLQLFSLRNLIRKNPITAGAMTAAWLLIFFLKLSTPVDASSQILLAHFDPHKPVYLTSLSDEILLAEWLEEAPAERRMP